MFDSCDSNGSLSPDTASLDISARLEIPVKTVTIFNYFFHFYSIIFCGFIFFKSFTRDYFQPMKTEKDFQCIRILSLFQDTSTLRK